jgi:hypothetical protein
MFEHAFINNEKITLLQAMFESLVHCLPLSYYTNLHDHSFAYVPKVNASIPFKVWKDYNNCDVAIDA